MKFSIATLLVSATAVSATSIKANSKAGSRLLSSARRLDGNDGDMAWTANYSLKFEKCATSTDYYAGYFGGNQNNQNNNRQNYNGMYQQRLVHFKLCPSDTCGSGCSGGADYVVDMNEFVGSYLEYKTELQEAECETAKENCYCDDNDDEETCLNQCLTNAGLYDQCADKDNDNNNNNGNGEEEFDLQEASECARLDIDEEAAQYYAYQNGGQNQYYNGGQNNQNNQNVEFFVGPHCSANGKNIYLSVFMDEVCSYAAPDGVYEKFHYGKSLPYSSTSIIEHDCISCMAPKEENDDDQEQEDEVLEVCERLYEGAGKCETNLQVYGVYPNTMACDFIKGLNAWGKTRIAATFHEAAKKTPQILAGVFAASTVVFGGVAYYMHKKAQRQSVGLVHDGQMNLA